MILKKSGSLLLFRFATNVTLAQTEPLSALRLAHCMVFPRLAFGVYFNSLSYGSSSCVSSQKEKIAFALYYITSPYLVLREEKLKDS